MKIGIVMPAVLQTESLLNTTLRSLSTIVSKSHELSIHLICNRLSICLPGDLAAKAAEAVPGVNLTVVHEHERTVSGAWNEGLRRAFRDDADFGLLMANDAFLNPDAIDVLVEWGLTRDPRTVALWTGCQEHLASLGPGGVAEGGDFTLAMLAPETLAVHGYFDENFRPAYFEDNDYFARVALAQQACMVVHGATYVHHGGGSQTKAADPDSAHHIDHWFGQNRDYFVRKWGRTPADSGEEIRRTYFLHPFNDPRRPLSYWELEPGRR